MVLVILSNLDAFARGDGASRSRLPQGFKEAVSRRPRFPGTCTLTNSAGLNDTLRLDDGLGRLGVVSSVGVAAWLQPAVFLAAFFDLGNGSVQATARLLVRPG